MPGNGLRVRPLKKGGIFPPDLFGATSGDLGSALFILGAGLDRDPATGQEEKRQSHQRSSHQTSKSPDMGMLRLKYFKLAGKVTQERGLLGDPVPWDEMLLLHDASGGLGDIIKMRISEDPPRNRHPHQLRVALYFLPVA